MKKSRTLYISLHVNYEQLNSYIFEFINYTLGPLNMGKNDITGHPMARTDQIEEASGYLLGDNFRLKNS